MPEMPSVFCDVPGACAFSDVGLSTLLLCLLYAFATLCKHRLLRGSKSTAPFHQHHLVAPIDLPLPEADTENHFDFFSWCSICLSWLRQNP